MNHLRRYLAGVVLVGCAFLIEGCGPPPANSRDTTAPGFAQVIVRLEKPGDPNSRGDFDITSTDVTKNNIPSDLVIRILATAGDSESGITGVTLATRPVFDKAQNKEVPSNLTWECSAGTHPPGGLVPVLQAGTLPFTLAAPPAPPPALWQVNAVANPITTTGCSIDTTRGVGPVGVEGFIRLTTTNGAGLTSASKTFIFSYADVGS